MAVWDPYRQGQIDAIEAVQRLVARFIKGDYSTNSVTEMLQSLDLDSLNDRRKIHRFSIFHLAVNNCIALLIPDCFLLKQRITGLFKINL